MTSREASSAGVLSNHTVNLVLWKSESAMDSMLVSEPLGVAIDKDDEPEVYVLLKVIIS